MAATAVVDAGFLIALLLRSDRHHGWASALAGELPRPWLTCDAALSEALHLVEPYGKGPLLELLGRGVLRPRFDLASELDRVLALLRRYADLPMSLADACLVRMTEILPEPVLATTDGDFLVYRRHRRQAIPALLPERRRR